MVKTKIIDRNKTLKLNKIPLNKVEKFEVKIYNSIFYFKELGTESKVILLTTLLHYIIMPQIEFMIRSLFVPRVSYLSLITSLIPVKDVINILLVAIIFGKKRYSLLSIKVLLTFFALKLIWIAIMGPLSLIVG